MNLWKIWVRGLEALCIFVVFSCTVFMMMLALSTVSNGVFMIIVCVVFVVIAPFVVGSVIHAVKGDA